MDLARNLGLSLETHLVHKEDGYVLQVYNTEASLRCSIISNRPHQKTWFSFETHLVHTDDGYFLQVYSTEASHRYRYNEDWTSPETSG